MADKAAVKPGYEMADKAAVKPEEYSYFMFHRAMGM